MKTAEYCAALKRRLKLTSDYQLAKRLGVAKQTISNYVNGYRVFDNTMAVRTAELLGLSPLQVIADAELERGSSPDLWKRLRDAAAWTAVAIGVACFGLEPAPAQASGFNNNFFAVNSPVPGGGEGAPSIEQKYTLRRIGRTLVRSAGAAIAALLAWLALVAL